MINLRKTLVLLIFVLFLAIAGFSHSMPASAQTDAVQASESWDSSCNGTVNGSTSDDVYVANGDTINLQITNTSTQTLGVSVSGDGQSIPRSTLTPGDSESYSLTVSTGILVQAIATSCSSNGNVSDLTIFGASASLSCSLSDNQVWNITGQYSNADNPVSLYGGSTSEGNINGTKGGPGSSGASINEQFAAESTAQTYYLYDGSSSSSELITQITCPAIVVTTTPKPKSTTTSTASGTPAPQATTPTNVTPTTKLPSSTKVDNKSTAVNLDATNTSINKKGIVATLIFFIILGLASIFLLVCMWRIFSKAGVAGWKALIPLYNTWLLFEMGGEPGWWSIILLIPIINIVALVKLAMAYIEVAHRFSKSTLFGILGLFIFGIIGWPILAFSNAAKYSHKPVATDKPEN